MHQQGSSQDRMAMLEQAVAGLAAASAAQLGKLTSLMSSMSERLLAQQNMLQGISEQQKLIGTKLDDVHERLYEEKNKTTQEIEEDKMRKELSKNLSDSKAERVSEKDYKPSVEQNVGHQNATVEQLDTNVEQEEDSASSQEYINWDQTHSELEQRLYIPYVDFVETYQLLFSGEYEGFLKIMKTPFKVNKTTRFPSDGEYLNIFKPKIKDNVDYILYAIENKLPDYKWRSQIIQVHDEIYNSVVKHDVRSFEDEYKLKWSANNGQQENVSTIKHQKQEYVNWGQTHDILQRHSYVPLQEFMYYIRSLTDNGEHKKILLGMLESPAKVGKTTRFPSAGLYLNINVPVIQFYLEDIYKHCGGSFVYCSSEINKLHDAIDNIMTNELGGVYDQISFEEKYNLVWMNGAEQNDNDDYVKTDRNGYVNWSTDHDSLKLHSYVPIGTFLETVRKLEEIPRNLTAEAREMIANKQIAWGWVFKVKEDSRFPNDGTYLNVNMPTLNYHIKSIFNAISEDIKSPSVILKCSLYISTFLKMLLDRKNHKNFIHNVVSFEHRYNLKWIEKTD